MEQMSGVGRWLWSEINSCDEIFAQFFRRHSIKLSAEIYCTFPNIILRLGKDSFYFLAKQRARASQ
jgi:hypothetical protein